MQKCHLHYDSDQNLDLQSQYSNHDIRPSPRLTGRIPPDSVPLDRYTEVQSRNQESPISQQQSCQRNTFCRSNGGDPFGSSSGSGWRRKSVRKMDLERLSEFIEYTSILRSLWNMAQQPGPRRSLRSRKLCILPWWSSIHMLQDPTASHKIRLSVS